MTNLDVKTYIKYFDRTWSDLMKKQDQFPLQDYGERSMLTTWKLSYNQVMRQSETAAWLLRLWAFFHHDDLWHGLLAKSGSSAPKIDKFVKPTWLVELSESELGFSSAMGLLKAYSLAESTGGRSYTMHPVLHRWSRSLSLDADAALLIYISIRLLASATPSKEDAMSWKMERRLLQHVLHACNELLVARTLAQLEFPSRAAHCLGLLLYRQGKLDESEQMYLQVLSVEEKELGTNHISTLVTVNSLGILYWRQGELEEADQMLKRALLGCEKELGPNHKSTLDIVDNLGVLYSEQGKLEESEQMHLRALLGYEKTLGPNHTSTLQIVNNLGILYHEQGKLEEAEQMLKRALLGCEKELGLDHTSTLDAVNSLGIVYHAQGKPDEAERMYQRVLTSHEKTYGKEGLTVSLLDTINNIGSLYRHQGRLDEAEKMLRRALAGYEKMYRKDAPTIPLLTLVYNLGLLYHEQGRLDEAEEMYERALAGRQKTYGRSRKQAEAASEQLALIRSRIGESFKLLVVLIISELTISSKPLEMPNHYLQQSLHSLCGTRHMKTCRSSGKDAFQGEGAEC